MKNIIVLQTAFLGDVLLSIPLLKRIKKNWPTTRLHLVVREGLAPLMLRLGIIDFVYEVKKSNRQSYLQLANKLSNENFDLLFSHHPSLRTALFARQIFTQSRMGIKKMWNGWFYDQRLPFRAQLPEALRQMSLLTPYDKELKTQLEEYEKEYSISELGPVPEWSSMMVANQKQKIKRVCLFPGSVWATKRWTVEGFIEVGKYFSQLGFEVSFLGSKQEQSLCLQCSQAVSGSRNLAGQLSLIQSYEYLTDSALMIGNDSGGQHLAAVAGTPTVSVFGPTTLSLGFRPWNAKSVVVENRLLSCRPCGKHGHKKCPLGTHECVNSIRAETVVNAARTLINF